MADSKNDPAGWEHLVAGGLRSRGQFIQTLAALGLTACGIDQLLASAPRVGAEPASRLAAEERYLLVIVMDGFRADYETLAPMRHLRALVARGATYDTAWVGHLESETPTGHATIGTGVYPRKHGVVGFGWRDLTTDNFTYLPTDLTRISAGDLTATIAQGGVPTISDLIHQRNRRDLVISLSGEKYYAAASMGAGADYVLYGENVHNVFRPLAIGPDVPPARSGYHAISGDSSLSSQDLFAAKLAVQMLRTMRPRALLINLPDADIAGHYYGGMRSPRDMSPVIKGDDWAIGHVLAEYERLGLLDKTVVVVTADHGMAANHRIVPIHAMYRAVSQASSGSLDEELRISMGSVWLRQSQQDATLAAALVSKRFPGVEGALYKVPSATGWTFTADPATARSLPAEVLRAYLHLAATEACPAGPEVILPYEEDTMGLTVKGRKRWGTHGGFSWGVQHIPLVIAGPGVRPGVSHFPAKLVDVAPTIERLLGLPVPAGVDGVILADSLADPTPAEHLAQQAVKTDRLAHVQALHAHSENQSSWLSGR